MNADLNVLSTCTPVNSRMFERRGKIFCESLTCINWWWYHLYRVTDHLVGPSTFLSKILHFKQRRLWSHPAAKFTVRLLAPSLARSLALLLTGLFAPSLARSLARSPARSLTHLLAHPLTHNSSCNKFHLSIQSTDFLSVTKSL